MSRSMRLHFYFIAALITIPFSVNSSHGYGRGPYPVSSHDIGMEKGPDQRDRIDAGVIVEITIFVHQDRFAELGRYILERRKQAVLVVLRKGQPHKLAVAVEDSARVRYIVQDFRLPWPSILPSPATV